MAITLGFFKLDSNTGDDDQFLHGVIWWLFRVRGKEEKGGQLTTDVEVLMQKETGEEGESGAVVWICVGTVNTGDCCAKRCSNGSGSSLAAVKCGVERRRSYLA
ncbi:hypothetical protein L1887_34552 [Cichorium endivia]|nr:hypothetical protein L1887_34552 [Cichorium endivia]